MTPSVRHRAIEAHYYYYYYSNPHTGAVTPLRQLHSDPVQQNQTFCRPGESTLLVSLDLSAAFDTIDHAILATRPSSLDVYGVDGTALN